MSIFLELTELPERVGVPDMKRSLGQDAPGTSATERLRGRLKGEKALGRLIWKHTNWYSR